MRTQKAARLQSWHKLFGAAALALVMLAASVPAQAAWHGRYHDGWGWGPGPGITLDFGAPYYYDNGPGPGYYDPYYGPYYPR
jgi:hypothetical protein